MIFADTSSPAERTGSFKITCKDHMLRVFGKGMREPGENMVHKVVQFLSQNDTG